MPGWCFALQVRLTRLWHPPFTPSALRLRPERLSETGARLFDLNGSRGLPYDLREGIALNSSFFYVLELDWNTFGAQEFPFGVLVVSNETISQQLGRSSVVYVGGPLGEQLVLFRTGN